MYKFVENKILEHIWSEDSKEMFAQLYFQLLRSNNTEVLEIQYRTLLKKKDKNLMNYLYKLIAQTRDIIKGKGEYNLSYMLLGEWLLLGDEYIPDIYKVLDLFVDIENEHPYGSWKDLKYFCHYICKQKSYVNKNHEIIDYCCEKIANQLFIDNNSDNPTLCAKWAPREKSKFGWITPIISKKLVYKFKMDNLSKNESIRINRQTCYNLTKR